MTERAATPYEVALCLHERLARHRSFGLHMSGAAVSELLQLSDALVQQLGASAVRPATPECEVDDVVGTLKLLAARVERAPVTDCERPWLASKLTLLARSLQPVP